MKVLALICSRDTPDEACQVFTEYNAVLMGDGTEFERLYKSRLAAVQVPAIIFRPYFKVDSTAKFSPGQFFAANRQKIKNADDVLIIRTGDDETIQAEEYARKLDKSVTVLDLRA